MRIFLTIIFVAGAGAAVFLVAHGTQQNENPSIFEQRTTDSLNPGDIGPIPRTLTVGDPINASCGNMYYEITDIAINSDYERPLTFTRSYNSGGRDNDKEFGLGPRWTHSFSTEIIEDSLGWVTMMKREGGCRYFHDFRSPQDPDYRLEYDEKAKRYSVVLPDNEVLVYRHDGRLAEIRDRDYVRVTLTYKDDRLWRATDASGRYLEFSYNGAGRIHTISLADGSTYLTYEYDPQNRDIVSKVTYADGSWESYEYRRVYHTTELMVKRCTSDGVCQYYEYDNGDHVTANYGNDSVNLITLRYYLEPSGSREIYYCTKVCGQDTVIFKSQFIGNTGKRMLIEKTLVSAPKCPDHLSMGYDSVGNERFTRIGDDIIDSLEYDTLGRETFQLNRDDKTGFGQYSSSTFQPSRFNLQDRISTTSPDSYDTSVVKYEYDDHGNISTILEYQMSGVSGSAVNKATIEYNDRGQVIHYDGPDVGETDVMQFDYYPNGDLKKCTTGAGKTQEYGQRDALGNIPWMRYDDGSKEEIRYDKRGRLTGSTYCNSDAGCETSSCKYNFAGDYTHLEYADGSTVDYTYDNHGWLTEVDHSCYGRIIYFYDSYGNVRKSLIISAAGDTTTFHSPEAR